MDALIAYPRKLIEVSIPLKEINECGQRCEIGVIQPI
jgi:hypothetical protein